MTAKAALTQIVNQVFQRLEKHAVVIQQQQQSEKKVAASAPASPELNGAAGAAGVNGAAATSSDVGTSVQSSPSPLSPLKAPGSATDGTDGGDNAVEAAGAAKTPSPATVGDGQPGKYGFCIVRHKKADHYCSQTKDPVCSKECKMVGLPPSWRCANVRVVQVNLERIEAEEKRRQEDINQAMNYLSVTTGDGSCSEISFQCLKCEPCRLFSAALPCSDRSRRKDGRGAEPLRCHVPVVHQNPAKGRVFALPPLVLSVQVARRNQPGAGPDFQRAPWSHPCARTASLGPHQPRTRLPYKRPLRVPGQEGPLPAALQEWHFVQSYGLLLLVVSHFFFRLPKPTASLFDLSLSIFLMLLSHFKAPLKSEIQVLFRDIFLQILGAPSSSYHQKSMVMQVCQIFFLLIFFFLTVAQKTGPHQNLLERANPR